VDDLTKDKPPIVIDKKAGLLWDDGKMNFVKGEWLGLIHYAESELTELCRADSVDDLRWFPTSERDGEWLVVDCTVDNLFEKSAGSTKRAARRGSVIGFWSFGTHSDNWFSIYSDFSSHNKVYSKYGIKDNDPLKWSDKCLFRLCFKDLYTYEEMQDFIHSQGGESTGPPVVNGFVNPYCVDIEEYNFNPSGGDIEIEEVK
jgi:hypothetical protein